MRKVLFHNCLMFVFICQIGQLNFLLAQQPQAFRHLTPANGLSTNYVHSLIQDDLGYIWIGTPEGLFRFDGQKVEAFPSNPRDSSAMQSDVINCLAKDTNGDLWIGSGEGVLQRRKKLTGRFESWKLPISEDLQVPTIWDIEVDEHGKIWMGLERSFAKFDPEAGTFQSWRPSNQNSKLLPKLHDVIYSIEQEPANSEHFYLGTRKGVLRFHRTKQTVEWIHPPDSIAMDLRAIWAMDFSHDGKLWLAGARHSAYEFDPQSYQWRRFQGPDQNKVSIWAILPVDETHVWLGNRTHGLSLLNPSTGEFTAFENRPGDSRSILPGGMQAILRDRNGNIWSGMDAGVSWMTPEPLLFQHFDVPNAEKHAPPVIPFPHSFLEIIEDSLLLTGIMWTSELGLFDLKKKEFVGFIERPEEAEYFINWSVRDMELGEDGRIYLASKSGIFRVDLEARKIVRPNILPEEIEQMTMWEMLADDRGNLWCVTYPYGLLRFNPVDETYRIFNWENDHENGYPKLEFINDIALGENGKIWFGGEPAIASIDPETENIQSFSTAEGLTHTWVRAIEAGDDGSIWVGYKYAGLDEFFPDEKRAVHYGASSGLPSNKIYRMAIDHEGYMWLATGNGLSRLDTEKKDFRNFQVRDGLRENDLHIQWQTSIYHSPSSRSFIGGPGFFTEFSPDKIVERSTSNQLVFNGISVFEQEKYFENDLNFLDEISLTWKENFFTFRFANLNHQTSEPPLFRYLLEGFDEGWRTTSIGSAPYTDVGKGKYKFRVQVANTQGEWETKNELNVMVKIIPPFWKTGWFVYLLAFVFATLLFAAYKYRIRRIKQKEAIKLAYDRRAMEAELKALRSQMNPHFLFNSLNSIKHYIARHDPRSAADYLTKFARLMRQILNNSRTPTVTLSSELAAIELYVELEQMRFPDKFEYVIELSDDISPKTFQVPPLLFQPYVENAIWHGIMQLESQGQLIISAERQNGHLEISVIDNGIGREASAKRKKGTSTRKSMGMQLSADRLRLASLQHKDAADVEIIDLKNEDGSAAGTHVKVRIPIQKLKP